MAKPELGTKRIDPDTGRKFYDLNKDPIVSPYTGKSYPLSFFEVTSAKAASRAAPVEDEEAEVETVEADETPNTVSLNDVEEDEDSSGDPIADIDDSDDETPDAGEDDTFLEEEEDDDDDMSDLIGGRDEDEEP